MQIKTVINAEEEHLASKSIKTTRKTLKKVIKTNSKTEILVETKLEDTGSTNSIRENDRKTVDSVVGAPVEPQELSGKNAGGDGDGNGNVVLKKKSKAKKPKKCEYDNQNISVVSYIPIIKN